MKNLETLIGGNEVFILGLVYVIGNIASHNGSRLYTQTALKKWKLGWQILILTLLGFLSFALLSIKNIICIFSGFLLLNIFKVLYRPIIEAELTSRFPLQCLKASMISVVALISSIIASLMHILLSSAFINPVIGNISIGILILIMGSLIGFLLLKEKEMILPLKTSALTGKENILVWKSNKIHFIQKYPPGTKHNHFEALEKIKDLSYLFSYN